MKELKKHLFIPLLVASLAAFVGCRQEGPAEEAGEKLDEAVEEAGEAVEETGENIRDTVK